ncbi:MAG: UbiA family prenyltransferase [Kiritimatiellia bacterium]|jgi:hypothetical protein
MKKPPSPWLVFFRLPNLPTAPGDALAGAAIAIATARLGGDALASAAAPAFAAGLAALLLYMFGLADNDIVGAEADKTQAPNRPIPSGTISLRQARRARFICLALAIATGAFARLPPAWWIVAAALVAAVAAYNRFKDRRRAFGLVAMGLCRGVNLLAGAAALASIAPRALRSPPVLLAALGWTAYIAAVTGLAADEHAAHAPLSWKRFLPGLAVFIPMPALAAYPRTSWPIIAVCSTLAYAVWALSVTPLGCAHDPDVRRKAVGNTIGALLYLQAGYILTFMHPAFIAAVIALFFSTSLIRKFHRDVPGS